MWTISRCLGALWRAGCMLVIPRCCCSPVHWALSSGLWSPFILGTVITLSRELFIAHHVPVIAACHVIVNTGIPVNTPHDQLPLSRLIFPLHVFCTQSTAHCSQLITINISLTTNIETNYPGHDIVVIVLFISKLIIVNLWIVPEPVFSAHISWSQFCLLQSEIWVLFKTPQYPLF